MAPHSSILAWRIPWTEEPGGLQSTGSRRVGYDLATEHTHMYYFYIKEKESKTGHTCGLVFTKSKVLSLP